MAHRDGSKVDTDVIRNTSDDGKVIKIGSVVVASVVVITSVVVIASVVVAAASAVVVVVASVVVASAVVASVVVVGIGVVSSTPRAQGRSNSNLVPDLLLNHRVPIRQIKIW